jgi:hypothetical protein
MEFHPAPIFCVQEHYCRPDWSRRRAGGRPVPVATAVPGIFTADASGIGPGAIANQDYSLNSPANPADRGSTVVLYLTGGGQTIPGGTDGKITTASAATPYVAADLRRAGGGHGLGAIDEDIHASGPVCVKPMWAT